MCVPGLNVSIKFANDIEEVSVALRGALRVGGLRQFGSAVVVDFSKVVAVELKPEAPPNMPSVHGSMPQLYQPPPNCDPDLITAFRAAVWLQP